MSVLKLSAKKLKTVEASCRKTKVSGTALHRLLVFQTISHSLQGENTALENLANK